MRLFAIILALVALIFAPGAAHAAEHPGAAGLSKDEAASVAARFFAEQIGMEGGAGEPTLKGDDWVFPAKFGAAGSVHRDPIIVNRRTGQATWAGLAEHNAFLGRDKKPNKPK